MSFFITDIHSNITLVYTTLYSSVSVKTRFCFISSNSSFTECVRTYGISQIIHSSNLKPTRNDINPECTEYTEEGKCLYEAQPVTLSGGEHTFSDSQFLRCHHSDCGGAIDQTGGGTLQIKRCLFDTCSCTQRGGAVSFRGAGTCIQEENLYAHCFSGNCSGAFSSFEFPERVTHNHKRCIYVNSEAKSYGHFCIEYSPDALIDSNIFIHGTSNSEEVYAIGTVVNYQGQGATVYSNCIFSSGKAYRSGGLSFLGVYTDGSATLSVQFCFFVNNNNTDGPSYDIHFDGNTSSNAREDLIIHSFSATPGSMVYIQNNPSQGQNWLPLGTLSYPNALEKKQYRNTLIMPTNNE